MLRRVFALRPLTQWIGRRELMRPFNQNLIIRHWRSICFAERVYQPLMRPGAFRSKTDNTGQTKTKEPTGLVSSIAKRKWPIIITTFIASIVGYFWKGYLERNDLEALQDRLDVRVAAPPEIKDLRLDNNIRVADFEELVQTFQVSNEPVTTKEVLAAANASFHKTAKNFTAIKHQHDLERLLLWVAQVTGDEHGQMPRHLALLCISVLVNSPFVERIPPIMRLFAHASADYLTRDEFSNFIEALMLTFQFPTEFLTVRVQKAWPEGLYEPAKHYEATPQQMTQLAFDAFAIAEKQAAEKGAAEELLGPWLPGFIGRRLDGYAASFRDEPVEEAELDPNALSCERVTRLLFDQPLCLWNRCKDGADDEVKSVDDQPILNRETDFEAASAFAGSKEGFAFYKGEFGLGYYRDFAAAEK